MTENSSLFNAFSYSLLVHLMQWNLRWLQLSNLMSNIRLHQTGLVEVNVIHIFTILRLDTPKKRQFWHYLSPNFAVKRTRTHTKIFRKMCRSLFSMRFQWMGTEAFKFKKWCKNIIKNSPNYSLHYIQKDVWNHHIS